MKQNQLVILGLIAVFLAVGVMLRRVGPESGRGTAPVELKLDMDPDQAVRIEMSRGEEGKIVELVRIGTVWSMPDFWNARADGGKVQSFLQSFQGAGGELRASDKELFDDFGISREDAVHLRFFSGSAARPVHLLAGTVSPDPDRVFIRSAGSADVFLAEIPLALRMGFGGEMKDLEPQADYWLSKKFAYYEPESISEITALRFHKGEAKTSFQMKKEGSQGWRLEVPDTAAWPGLQFESGKVTEYLGALTRLEALQILPPNAHEYGLENPLWQLDLRTESGEVIRLTLSAAGSGAEHTYLKVSSEPALYELSGFVARRLDSDPAEFFTEDMLALDPEKVSEVIFHTPEQELILKPEAEWTREALDRIYPLRLLRPAVLLAEENEAAFQMPGAFWIRVRGKQPEDVREIHFAEAPLPDDETVRVRLGEGTPFLVAADTFHILFDPLIPAEESGEAVS